MRVMEIIKRIKKSILSFFNEPDKVTSGPINSGHLSVEDPSTSTYEIVRVSYVDLDSVLEGIRFLKKNRVEPAKIRLSPAIWIDLKLILHRQSYFEHTDWTSDDNLELFGVKIIIEDWTDNILVIEGEQMRGQYIIAPKVFNTDSFLRSYNEF